MSEDINQIVAADAVPAETLGVEPATVGADPVETSVPEPTRITLNQLTSSVPELEVYCEAEEMKRNLLFSGQLQWMHNSGILTTYEIREILGFKSPTPEFGPPVDDSAA